MRSPCWLALLCTALIACQEPMTPPATTSSGAGATGAPATAGAAQASSGAAAPDGSSSTDESQAVQLSARPMLTASSAAEPFRVILHWHDPLRPSAVGSAANGPKVRWATASFVLEIQGPDGTAAYATGKVAQATLEATLAQAASVIALLGPEALKLELSPVSRPGVETKLVDAPWTGAAPDLSKPGRYRILVKATLDIGGVTQRFEAAPITIERVAEHKRLSEIEGIGRQAIEAHLTKQGLSSHIDGLAHALRTVDLPTGGNHRLVRFSMRKPSGSRYVRMHYEAVVAPDGKLIEVLEQERFTCVARGTPIATPSGPRAVDLLQPGDEVIAFDLSSRRRTVTSVVAVSQPHPAATLRLAGRLSLTPEHPVYRDGSWVPAGELRSGDEINLHGESLRLGTQDPSLHAADVVELSVGPPHNYFAAGILVHNKRIAVVPGRFDVWNVLWERAKGEYQLIPKPAPTKNP